jgi:hypothetical protein
VGDALGFFKPGVAFFQFAIKCPSFFLGALPFSDVTHDAYVLAIAGNMTAGVCYHMEISDVTVWQQQPVLKIKIHPISGCAISQLQKALSIFGMNPVEN